MKDEPAEILLSPHIIMDRFIDNVKEKYCLRYWWNAQIYEGWIVLYSAYDTDMEKPLKAWRRYEPNWDEEV